MRYGDIAIERGAVDDEAAAMQQPYGEIVDAWSPAERFEPLRHGSVARVNMDHGRVLVTDKKLDRTILPGLKAGRLPQQSAKFRILAGRHGAQHIPGRVELFKDAGYPRQRLEGRLQVIPFDQPAGGA